MKIIKDKEYIGYELELLELLEKQGFNCIDTNTYRLGDIDIKLKVIKHKPIDHD